MKIANEEIRSVVVKAYTRLQSVGKKNRGGSGGQFRRKAELDAEGAPKG